jgi:hypothetical protein
MTNKTTHHTQQKKRAGEETRPSPADLECLYRAHQVHALAALVWARLAAPTAPWGSAWLPHEAAQAVAFPGSPFAGVTYWYP